MIFKTIKAICILSLLLTTFWYVNAADAQGYVTDGLVAMYTLDEADVDGEVVMDASDSGNNAKLVGSLGFAEGPVGDALVFTAAADNYVEIPAMGGFEFASVECYAFEAAFAGIQGIISTWMWTAGKVHYKFQETKFRSIKMVVKRLSSLVKPTHGITSYTQLIPQQMNLNSMWMEN